MKSNRWLSLLIFFAYAALTVVMTWPIAEALGTHIPGSNGDIWVHYWTFNWIKTAVTTNQSLFFTDLTFYPSGVSLLTHNIAWVQIFIWLPLQALLGSATAFSLVYLLTITLNGFTTYLFAKNITQSVAAGFIGGIVVAFWPYNLSHHDHPNGIFIAAIPLTLLALKKLLAPYETERSEQRHKQMPQAYERQPFKIRHLLYLASTLALIGFVRWQHLIMSSFLITAYTLYLLYQSKSNLWLNLRHLFLSGILALIIMAPLLAPVVTNQLSRTNPQDLFIEEEKAQTDLLAYFMPSRNHPLWGDWALQQARNNNLGVNTFFTPYLGYTVLLLIIYAVLVHWRQARLWLGLTLLYIILALGPNLRIGGQFINIPLPFAWIDELFIIKLIRHADRLNYMLGIPVAMLVALGIKQLWQQLHTRRQTAVWLTTLCATLILGEYIARYPLLHLSTPRWYTAHLAQESGDFAIVGFPYDRFGPDKTYLFYQLTHGKALVNGKIARPPREALAFRDSVPLLATLEHSRQAPTDLINIGHQLRLLHNANVRYLILHKRHYDNEQLALWRDWLAIPPQYEDNQLIVYPTNVSIEPNRLQHILLSQPEGDLGLIETAVAPHRIGQEGWVEIDTRWGSNLTLNNKYDICVQLIAPNQQIGQTKCELLARGWTTNKWQAGEIVDPAPILLNIDPFLEPNLYDVTLQLTNHDTGQAVGQPAIIDQLTVETIPRLFEPPTPAETAVVTWGNTIYLSGYNMETDENNLSVTYFWQALQRMDASYKLFVHLRDEAGNVVAQIDTIPRNWSYPTTWWEANEFVADTIQLPLIDLPPGNYHLFVGWYDAGTGERLLPQTTNHVVDGAVRITSVQR